MNKLSSLLAAPALVLVAGVSHAATIDLTNASIGAQVNGLNKTTLVLNDVAGTDIDVTIKADGGTLYHQTGDGLGVKGANDTNCSNCEIIPDDWAVTYDEIDQKESIKVSFSQAVRLQSVGLTDLYANPSSSGWAWIPDETGKWTLYNGATQVGSSNFAGTQERIENNTVTNGNYTVNLSNLLGTALVLISTNQMLGYADGSPYKGFSLASVTFSPVGVPELSASAAGSALSLLVGIGLILADRRRRVLVAQS